MEQSSLDKVVHPPENPQHVLNNKIFGDIIKISEGKTSLLNYYSMPNIKLTNN